MSPWAGVGGWGFGGASLIQLPRHESTTSCVYTRSKVARTAGERTAPDAVSRLENLPELESQHRWCCRALSNRPSPVVLCLNWPELPSNAGGVIASPSGHGRMNHTRRVESVPNCHETDHAVPGDPIAKPELPRACRPRSCWASLVALLHRACTTSIRLVGYGEPGAPWRSASPQWRRRHARG